MNKDIVIKKIKLDATKMKNLFFQGDRSCPINEKFIWTKMVTEKGLFGKTKEVEREFFLEKSPFNHNDLVQNIVLVELPFSKLEASPILGKTYRNSSSYSVVTKESSSFGTTVITPTEITTFKTAGGIRDAWHEYIHLHMNDTGIDPIFIHRQDILGKFFDGVDVDDFRDDDGVINPDFRLTKNEELKDEMAYVVFLESVSSEYVWNTSEGKYVVSERRHPNILLTAGIVNKFSIGNASSSLSSYTEMILNPEHHFQTNVFNEWRPLSDVNMKDLCDGMEHWDEVQEDCKSAALQEVSDKQSWDGWWNYVNFLRPSPSFSFLEWLKSGECIDNLVFLGTILLVTIGIFSGMIVATHVFFGSLGVALLIMLTVYIIYLMLKKSINSTMNGSFQWHTFDQYREYSLLDAVKRSSTPIGVARTPILKLFKDIEPES